MKDLNKKLVKISAELEIESKEEINEEVIASILKSIDCWMEVHKIKNKFYISTLLNPKQNG